MHACTMSTSGKEFVDADLFSCKICLLLGCMDFFHRSIHVSLQENLDGEADSDASTPNVTPRGDLHGTFTRFHFFSLRLFSTLS